MKYQWKRNAVVATVLLFVCAAVYLNWRYAGNIVEGGEGTETREEGGSTRVLGDAALVGGTVVDAQDTATAVSSYFDTARLSRQQSRDNALSLLREASEQENVEQIENAILRELSEFEKQVFELHLTGMTYTEIAKVLGRDEKSTDNALQRMKSKIRKTLGKLPRTV